MPPDCYLEVSVIKVAGARSDRRVGKFGETDDHSDYVML